MQDLSKNNPLLKNRGIYFIVPTKGDLTTFKTRQDLQTYIDIDLYLTTCKRKNIYFGTGYQSIFSAYQGMVTSLSLQSKDQVLETDIIVMCHDDIIIQTKGSQFVKILNEAFENKNTGFVGVAGTSCLEQDAIWWNRDNWARGYHKGFVYHGLEMDGTYYGNPGRVVVLDGLFLACTWKTLQQINLKKPDYFLGNWDYYDLYYTLQAHELGLENKVVPIVINHMSRGELVGKDGWHQNRLAFINANRNKFPIKL